MGKFGSLRYFTIHIAVVFGLLWLGHRLYPSEKWNWLVLVTVIWTYQFILHPVITDELKKIIKAAMREKELEDAKVAQSASEAEDGD